MQSAFAQSARGGMLVLISALLLGILFPGPAGAAPSAVDQYLPRLDKGGVGDDEGSKPFASLDRTPATPEEAAGGVPAAADQPQGEASGGSIPGTGLPGTPLVVLVVLAVFAALAVRLGLPVVNRWIAAVRAR